MPAPLLGAFAGGLFWFCAPRRRGRSEGQVERQQLGVSRAVTADAIMEKLL